jgi:cyclophilin family peptidyl-prolyl cis-trans isomerase
LAARGVEVPEAGAPAEPAPSPFLARPVARTSRVVLETVRGDIEIELLPAEAAIHVANFLDLVDRGYYDGLIFHRVVPNFVIQGGDPRGDGWGGPGYALRDEINAVPFLRGTVGMPKAGKDTGGGQLFITHLPTPHLDGNYTVFGEVTRGLEVLDAIDLGDTIVRAYRVAER